jgi:hypothetical protein
MKGEVTSLSRTKLSNLILSHSKSSLYAVKVERETCDLCIILTVILPRTLISILPFPPFKTLRSFKELKDYCKHSQCADYAISFICTIF